MYARSSTENQIKAICAVMRRSNATSALQYIPELTWILFLRILDQREELDSRQSAALGLQFTPAISEPYRWRDWAAPGGHFRKKLQQSPDSVFDFVVDDLLPHLKALGGSYDATPKQRVISAVFAQRQRPFLTSEKDFFDVLDMVDDIKERDEDQAHFATISSAYENLLLKMGEKNNDGGQFFTPRDVIRTVVSVVDPQIGETVFDPAAGTGGFLALAYEHMKSKARSSTELTKLSESTYFGNEKDILIHPIALANLILHGIDDPRIWHGNTLTRLPAIGSNYVSASTPTPPSKFDVIVTNPPFGGREGADSQQRYAYKTRSTQVLFMQEIMRSLAPQGRAGSVVDEGFLFRTDDHAFIQTRRKLVEELDLYCVVCLPEGVFKRAGALNKTNLIFFNNGKPTSNVWYYDLTDQHVTKTKPLRLEHFDEFFKLLPERADSERSWTVPVEELVERNYDLKAVNPHRKVEVDTRTPAELLDILEAENAKFVAAIAALRELDAGRHDNAEQG